MNRVDRKIRQLCRLGIDSKSMIARLLELLHQKIPSGGGIFVWFDEDRNVIDLYDDRPLAYTLLPLYLSEFLGAAEREVFNGWAETSHHKRTVFVDSFFKVDLETLEKSALYKKILEPLGSYWVLHKPLWKNGDCLGVLQLQRSKGEPPFTAREAAELDAVGVLVADALTERMSGFDAFADRYTSDACFVVDAHLEIQHYSSQAPELMNQAISSQEMENKSALAGLRLPPAVEALCRAVQARVRDGQPAPESISIVNAWGKFGIVAKPMISGEGEVDERVIVIEVRRKTPIKLVLMNQLDKVDLTDRQHEVCLRICLGQSYSEIAGALGIRESTVISHKKEIFGKLGVGSKHELTDKVLSL